MDNVKLKFLDENAIHPVKGSKRSACWDLFALEDVTFYPGEIKLVRTGIAMEAPPGWRFNIYVRSSTPSKKGFMLANGVGIIDADYRGELVVQLINILQNYEHNATSQNIPYRTTNKIKAGDKIAQVEMVKDVSFLAESYIEVVAELSETARGAGGFGSTGG